MPQPLDELLVNGSFETGQFNPWVWGRHLLVEYLPRRSQWLVLCILLLQRRIMDPQDFAPTLTNEIVSATLWLWGNYNASDDVPRTLLSTIRTAAQALQQCRIDRNGSSSMLRML